MLFVFVFCFFCFCFFFFDKNALYSILRYIAFKNCDIITKKNNYYLIYKFILSRYRTCYSILARAQLFYCFNGIIFLNVSIVIDFCFERNKILKFSTVTVRVNSKKIVTLHFLAKLDIFFTVNANTKEISTLCYRYITRKYEIVNV